MNSFVLIASLSFLLVLAPLSAKGGQDFVVKNTGCDLSKSPDEYVASARTYQEKALYFLAIESYTCAIQNDPQRTQLYIFRADVLILVGQFERAEADINIARTAEPNSSMPHVLTYVVAFEQGQYDDALAEIETTLKLNHLDAYSYLVRGQIYVKLNDEAKALEAFNQYFQLQKLPIFEAKGYAEIGFAYAHFGDQAAAQIYLRQADAFHPDIGRLYLSIAQEYRARSNYEMALENLNKAIGLHTPNLVAAYYERAAIYMALKDDQKALNDCNFIIQFQAQKPDDFVCKGVILVDLRKIDQAINNFNHAIRLDANSIAAYSGRAVAEINMRAYDLALTDLNFAIQSEPLVSNNYRIRAAVYTSLNNASAAIVDYEMYLRLQGGAAINPQIVESIRRLQEKISNV